MQLQDLIPGNNYKVVKTITVKIMCYGGFLDTQPLKKGTVFTVIRQNEKSVTIEIKFKDKDRQPMKGRLVYDDNDIIEVE